MFHFKCNFTLFKEAAMNVYEKHIQVYLQLPRWPRGLRCQPLNTKPPWLAYDRVPLLHLSLSRIKCSTTMLNELGHYSLNQEKPNTRNTILMQRNPSLLYPLSVAQLCIFTTVLIKKKKNPQNPQTLFTIQKFCSVPGHIG